MEERYYIEVGNCFVKFLGLWHEIKMCLDYHNAEVYWTTKGAEEDAMKYGVKNFKVVRKCL